MGENDWTTPGTGDQPLPPGWSGQQPPAWAQPGSAGPAGVPPGAAVPPPQAGWTPPPPWVTPRAPKPGIIPLRPLGLGEILDGAVGAMRNHPRATLGTSALVVAAVSLLALPVAWLADQASGAGAAYNVLSNLVSLAAWALLVGILTVMVGRAVLGQPVGAREAWAAFRPRIRSLLAVMVLSFLIVVAPVVAGALPGLVALVLGAPDGLTALLFGLGITAGFVAAVYLAVSLILAVPAAVLEAQPARRALSRSRRLVAGGWWRMFGIYLLAVIIINIVVGILTIPLVMAGAAGGAFVAPDAGDTTITVTMVTFTVLASIVSGTLTYPFLVGVQTLLYVDRRMRREGLDIQLARTINRPETPGTAATPGPPPQW